MSAVYVCWLCGKRFNRGAYIEGTRVWCMDCRSKFEEIVDDYIMEYIEGKIFNKQICSIDEFIEKRKKDIESLKIPVKMVKKDILFRLYSIERISRYEKR